MIDKTGALPLAERTHPDFTLSPEQLSEFRRLAILGAPLDSALNSIVRVAAGIFDAPSAVVAIVDESRLRFKVRHGVDAAECPRSFTFTGIVIEQCAPLFVADASAEPRWASMRAVAPPDCIRFYAGVPLRADTGAVFGALCVFARQPHPASSSALVPVLEDLAQAVAATVETHSRQGLRQLQSIAGLRLRDSALAACSSGLVIADAKLPDTPIIYCNPAFERMTGYRLGEIAGLNCRLLQGEETDPAAVAQLHAAIHSGEGTQVLLRNYRKDGTPFWNNLTLSPVRDSEGRLTHFIGAQNDATARVETEREWRKLAEVVDTSSDFVVVSTPAGEVQYLNRAGRRMLGIPETGALPTSRVSRYVTPDSLRLVRSTIRPLIRRGERWEGPCTIRHFVTNEIVELEGSCFPVPGPSHDEPVCLAAVLRNVTREHRAIRALSYSEHRFRDVVAASGALVWEAAPDLTFTYLSDRVLALLGYHPAELVGQDALSLIHPDEVPKAREWFNRAFAQGWRFRSRELRALTKDGSVVWLSLSGSPVFHADGSLASYRGVCLDVSENRRAQLELKSAKEAADEAARVKSLFLANMSHEIRTPLSGIIGMTSILLDSGLTSSQRESVETIRGSGKALLNILSDILDISQIESGRLEVVAESFDLHQCVAGSVHLFQSGAAAKGVALSLNIGADVPVSVVGDSLRLRQILNNLIGNALKFAGPCSIQISAAVGEETASGWILRFDVADSGAGIPADRVEELFNAFSQADPSSRRQHGGTGLGLAISKRLAELMGGTMWLQSEPGSGSTFSFTIRVGRYVPQGVADSVPAGSSVFDASLALRCPLRILVADDNPINRKVATFFLRKLGYEADMVTNGCEVLERLKTNSYELILLDIQMPGMDGLQAARAVRSQFGHPERPWLVALTANVSEDDRSAAKEAGMNDYLCKPIQGPELQFAIEHAWSLGIGQSKPREMAWELPEGLREAFGADAKSVVDEILLLYLQDSEPLVGDILAAQASKDTEALERLLHRLKGSSAQIGALRLSSLCREAEDALRGSGPGAPLLTSYLGELGEEWKRASSAIRNWLGPAANALERQ